MARLGINTGAIANDGTGDSLRSAGGKINNNFLELYTYLGAGSTDTLSAPIWNTTSSGINTLRSVGLGTTNPRFALEVGSVGASGTSLWINGDARITGILTVGSSSITLDGSSNTIRVGSGITINGNSGIISATAINLGGTTLTGAAVTYITAGSGISVNQNTGNVTITATGGGGGGESYWASTAAGIHTLSNVGIGTTNPTSTLTVNGGIGATTLNISGVSTFTGNVSFGSSIILNDSQQIILGNDSDVQIYYNGGTNYTEILNSSEKFRINTATFDVWNASTSEKLLTAASNAGVELYYDNSKKIETLGTGVTVTGTTFTNQLSVSGVSTFVGNLIIDGSINSSSGFSTFAINSARGVDFVHQSSFIGKIRISGDGYYGNGRLAFYNGSNNEVAVWDSNLSSGSIDIYNYTNSGTQNITISAGSSVVLQHGGTNTKLQTLGAGVTVTGTTFTNQLSVSGVSTLGTDTRLNSVSEKSSIGIGNTVNLIYNAGEGNIGIITNPSGIITLNVTGIPTDSSFDNRVLTFSMIVKQGTTGYACTTVSLNGLTTSVQYPGGVISVGSTSAYDIFNFTCINTIGSASTTANYVVLGMVNGNFK